VDVEQGRLGNPTTVGGSDPVTRAGTLPGGVEWRFLGQRTLQVRTPEGRVWSVMALANLRRAPLLEGGVLVLLDESGTVIGLRPTTGDEVWRRTLGSPPAQQAYASPIGLLVSTIEGSAYALSPVDGKPRRLAAGGASLGLALPFGSGALLLGSGPAGLRRVGPDDSLEPLGAATLVDEDVVWVTSHGVGWLDADGVRYLAADRAAAGPVAVPALGPTPVSLCGDGRMLLSVDAAGTVRAVSLDAPASPAWQASLGGRPQSDPVLTANALFILVDGGVVAVER
jgi:outer membrane protein assembly factor BamB